MKKIFLITSIFMAIGGLFASCEKNTNTEQLNCSSITIEFCLDDDEGQTKSSSTASLSLDNGCTIAFYSQSNGSLLVTGSCEGSSRKITITNVPDEDCNVYCVGNTSFSWPASETNLPSQAISIDVTKGSIPRSTLTGDYTWTVGTSTIIINHMPIMYVPLMINRELPNGVSFVAESAKISNCPNEIFPFGENATGTSGTGDTATSQDIAIFNSGSYFTLYVPSNGNTKVELTGTRHNGDGYNYSDKYTLTVPSSDLTNRETNCEKSITVNGENTGNQIVVIIGTTDTRTLTFGTSTLNVTGNGSIYSTYVKGLATNGDKNWTYDLSWTGNSELSNTYISVNGENYQSLGTSGSITNIYGDENEKSIKVYSSYSGSSTPSIILTASVADITESMTINVEKASEIQSITIEEASEEHILFSGESINLHAVGHYSDGTTAYISDQVTWIKAGAFGTSTLTVNGDYATFTAGTPSGSDHTSGNILCQYVRTGQSPLMSDYCPIKIDAPSGIAFYDIDTNLPSGESKTIYVKKTYYYSEYEKIAASSLSFDAEGNSMFTISGNTIRANDCSTAQAAILGTGVLTVHGSFTENGTTFSNDTTYTIKRYKYVTYVNGEGTLNSTFYLTVHYHDGTTSTTTNYKWKKQSDSSWSDGPLVPTESLTYQFQYTDIIIGAVRGTRSWAVNIYF